LHATYIDHGNGGYPPVEAVIMPIYIAVMISNAKVMKQKKEAMEAMMAMVVVASVKINSTA